MPDQNTCDLAITLGDDVLRCDLSADHVTPTEELPQGTPHETGEHHDSLTGDPWRWWG